MKTIEDRIKDKLESKHIWLKHISSDSINLKGMSLNFRFLEIDYAVKSIKDKEFQKSKQHFFIASLIPFAPFLVERQLKKEINMTASA